MAHNARQKLDMEIHKSEDDNVVYDNDSASGDEARQKKMQFH